MTPADCGRLASTASQGKAGWSWVTLCDWKQTTQCQIISHEPLPLSNFKSSYERKRKKGKSAFVASPERDTGKTAESDENKSTPYDIMSGKLCPLRSQWPKPAGSSHLISLDPVGLDVHDAVSFDPPGGGVPCEPGGAVVHVGETQVLGRGQRHWGGEAWGRE